MEYRVIDRSNWQRKEYFEHYLKVVPCTYSITTKLDITAIKKQRLKLYPTISALHFSISPEKGRVEETDHAPVCRALYKGNGLFFGRLLPDAGIPPSRRSRLQYSVYPCNRPRIIPKQLFPSPGNTEQLYEQLPPLLQ